LLFENLKEKKYKGFKTKELDLKEDIVDINAKKNSTIKNNDASNNYLTSQFVSAKKKQSALLTKSKYSIIIPNLKPKLISNKHFNIEKNISYLNQTVFKNNINAHKDSFRLSKKSNNVLLNLPQDNENSKNEDLIVLPKQEHNKRNEKTIYDIFKISNKDINLFVNLLSKRIKVEIIHESKNID
jgi:hypothetical protein